MTRLAPKKDSIWSVPFVLMMVINFFDTICFQMLRAMMTQYALDIGIATAQATVLTSVLSFASLFMRPVAGRLVDTKNNKNVMRFAYIGMVITMGLYFVAKSYPLLIIVRLLNGIFYGISAVCTVTIAGTLLPEDKMGSGIGLFGMGLAVSVTFSSMIGIWLYGFGSAVLFGASLFSAAACLILTFFIPNVERKRNTEERTALQIIKGLFAKEVFPVAFLNMLFCIAHSVMGVFLVVFFNARNAEGVGMGTAGVFYMVWGLTLFLARPIAGKLFDKYGLIPVESLCLICFFLFNVLIAYSTGWVATLIAAVVGSFGFGGSVPVLQAAAFKSAPPEKKGAANSTNLMGGDLGNALGGVFYGYIATWFVKASQPSFGYQISFLVAGGICLLALLYMFVLVKFTRFGKKVK